MAEQQAPAPNVPADQVAYSKARAAEASTIARAIEAEVAKDGRGKDDYGDTPSVVKTQTSTETAQDDGTETPTETEDGTVDAPATDTDTPASFSGMPDSAKEALAARDLPAFADALGISEKDAIEFFKVDASTYRANRLERQAIREKQKLIKKLESDGLSKLTQKETLLTKKFGDPEAMRSRWERGEVGAFFEAMEAWAGVPSKDVQKAWYKWIAEGKTDGLSDKAKLARLEKAEKDRQTPAADPVNDPAEVKKAHDWIDAGIRGDKLEKYPGVTKSLFEIMRAEYHSGCTTPKKAMEIFRKRLKEEAKTKAKFGIINLKDEETPAVKPTQQVMQKSPPRRDSLRSTTANSRRMNDREIAAQVVSELGLRQI